MIEVIGLPDDPLKFVIIMVVAGFASVAAAKLYGLLFMRWKTPFRMGDAMNVRHAEVVDWTDGPKGGEGYISADGELWRATSKDALAPGDAVSINAVKGLTLSVARKSA